MSVTDLFPEDDDAGQFGGEDRGELEDGSTGGGGGGGVSVSLESLGIGWVTQLRVLTTRPTAWIVGTLVAGLSVDQAYARMQGGETAVELIVEQYIYAQLLRPALLSLWDGGLAIIDSIIVIILGSDGALGIAPGTTTGIADIPYLFLAPIAEVIVVAGTSITGVIGAVNASVADAIVPLGIAATPVVAFFWAAEIAVALWVLWIVINFLDPGIIVPGTRAATRPIRNAMGWLF